MAILLIWKNSWYRWSPPLSADDHVVGFGLFGVQQCYLSYQKKTGYFPIISGAGLLANLGLNLWLVPSHGIRGAALATAISSLAMNLVMILVMIKTGREYLERLWFPLISIAIAILGVIVASQIPLDWSWWPRLGFSGLAVLLMAAFWWLLRSKLIALVPDPR